MATQLHKISWPALTSGNFGQGLVAAFKNIDSNFQKLASLGLTTGESGTPAVWVPYNLNSVFCKLNSGDFVSDYLNESMISDIRKSFENYNQITGFDQSRYIAECKELYKRFINDLPGEQSSVQSSNQTTWTHKWELIGNKYIFDLLDTAEYKDTLKNYIGYTDGSGKYIEGQYLSFLPGDILVAGNYDSESGVFTKLSTTAHIYIDPRFRNPLTVAGDVNTEELSKMTDYSCVLYGSLDGDVFKFKYVYAFPRIHCNSEGDFYLSVNGIDTNIPLTGRAGDSGKDAQFAVVQIAESVNIEDLNEIIYDTSENVGRAFEIGKKIDGDLGDPSLLNGCPAIIFPPTTYTINAYTTLYWVGYLKYNGGKLTVYCGRENLIKFDLDGHLFGGMMMGLDMYEKSIARPAGSTPWVKPRGLMLPIGSRYIGADGQGYWDPGVDQVGETTDFAAHLIYSEKPDSSSLKTNLHIGSIKDYRLIGLPNDPSGPDPVTLVKNNKVEDTNLFIDEPVIITNYGNTEESLKGVLLRTLGDAHVTGNVTAGGNLATGWDLTVGQEDEAKSGTVRANKYIKRGSQPGQILLANGDITSKSPIKLYNSDLGNAMVTLELKNDGDVSEDPTDSPFHFSGNISTLIPKPPKLEYIGYGRILRAIGESHNPNGDTHDWIIGSNPNFKNNKHNWSPKNVNKALGLSGVTFPDAKGGLAGVAVSYRMGNLILTRVILAANSDYGDRKGVKYFGLPIYYQKGDSEYQVARFTDMHIGDVYSGAKPKTGIVSAYWGAQQSQTTYMGGDGWQTKDTSYPTAGAVCSINADGKVLLSGASVDELFASTKFDNDAYIEFNLVYEGYAAGEIPTTPEQTTTKTQYHVVTGSLPSTGKINLENTATFDSLAEAQASGQTGYIIAVTQTSTGETVEFPTKIDMDNLADGTSVQQITSTHYWKLSKAPTSETILYTSGTNYNQDSIKSDWADNKIWYLVKAICARPSIAPNTGLTYGAADGTEKDSWITQWDCSIQLPSAVTYKWHQNKTELNAILPVYSGAIKTYLTNTLLLYRDECVGEWKGSLASLIYSNSEQYRRFAGPHGVVSASHYLKDGAWTTEITIEAWLSDLESMISIPGHKLELEGDTLTITSLH